MSQFDLSRFEQVTRNLGTQISGITNRVLGTLSPVVAQIKANAPSDTGGLRNSIAIGYEEADRSIYLVMRDYGFFQNYGVGASPSSRTAKNFGQRPVEGPIYGVLPPRSGNFYRFGTKQSDKKPWGAFYSGLNAVGFFSMAQIEQDIVNALNQEVNNITQL
jgi:hypothetical protein